MRRRLDRTGSTHFAPVSQRGTGGETHRDRQKERECESKIEDKRKWKEFENEWAGSRVREGN